MFRGREMAHPERGEAILNRLAEDLGSWPSSSGAPSRTGAI